MCRKKNKLYFLFISFCFVFALKSFAQTATYNIILNISGNSVLTDASQDDSFGINPVFSESATVIPDVGAGDVSVSSVSRLRTNENTWMLEVTPLSSSYGLSMITDSDIFYMLSQMAGSSAIVGSFVPPYTGTVTYQQLSSNMNVITGSQMTSTSRGSPIGSNVNNYVQVTTTTIVEQDYFYEEDATPAVDVQFSLVAP